MKRSALLILLILLGSVVLPIHANAASWQSQESWTLYEYTPASTNLTLTTVSGSAWVTGGYDFKKAYTYATSTGFMPFNNVSAFSIDIWFKPRVVSAGVRYLVSTYVSSSDQVALWQSGATFKFSVNVGTSSTVNSSITAVADKIYHVVGVWDADAAGGILTIYVNGTRNLSTRLVTANTGCADEIFVGAGDGSFNQANGTLYSVALYDRKLSWAEANRTGVARDLMLDDVSHYYVINEGSGTTFYDWSDTWFAQDRWSVTMPGVVPYQPVWVPQANWTFACWNDTAWLELITLTDLANFALLICGMAGTVIGPVMIIGSAKARDMKKLFVFAVLTVFCAGLWMGVLL